MLQRPRFTVGRFGYDGMWAESYVTTSTKSNNPSFETTREKKKKKERPSRRVEESPTDSHVRLDVFCTVRAKRFSISAGRNPVSQSPDPQFDDIPTQTPEVPTSSLCERVGPLPPNSIPLTRHNGFVRAFVAAPADPCDHPVAPLAPKCPRVADGGLPRLRPEADPASVAS